jgi:hypothetical protein
VRRGSSSKAAKLPDKRTASYRGVLKSYRKSFIAKVKLGAKPVHVGTWPTPEQAAVARDRAVLHFGLDLPLNIPKVSRDLGPAAPHVLVGQGRLALKSRAANVRTKWPTSRYYGVSWSPTRQCWVAAIIITGEHVHIGYFDDDREAALARDRYALHVLGPKTPLNFPNAGLKPVPLAQLRSASRQKRKLERASVDRRSSPFLGVTYRPATPNRPWRALIDIDRRPEMLGNWRSPEQAALAHDRAFLHYYGDPARINFPERAARLRPADASTLRQEATKKRKSETSSRFIGVSWFKRYKRWKASLELDGVRHHIGYFDNEEQAAVKRSSWSEYAIKLQARNARLNFHPKTGEEVHGRLLRELQKADGEVRLVQVKRRPRR